MNAPSIAVLGGGTGTYTVLAGLTKHAVRLSAVVSTADNGGHSGECRVHYGVLPPSDLLRAMIAMSRLPHEWLKLLGYRFKGGPYDNANFGNLLLTAQSLISQDSETPHAATHVLHRLLQVQGRAIPVSVKPSNLRAWYADGSKVDGEHEIGVPTKPRPPIVCCELNPPVEANPEALCAIREADLIIIAMGDLYTSIAPVLKVDGIAEALAWVHAPIVYVLNLATKQAETEAYKASRFVEVIERLMAPARLSAVIVNTGKPSDELVERHTLAHEPLTVDDLPQGGDSRPLIVRRGLLASYMVVPNPADKLAESRSYLRHDPDLLAQAILQCPSLLSRSQTALTTL